MSTPLAVRGTVLSVLTTIFVLSLAVPFFVHAQTATTASYDAYNSADVEARVRQYFSDIPAMPAIAKCESGFRQYGPDGLVLFDPSYRMIGVFQISTAHLPEALNMGMDVTTLEGNLVYARYLYNINGIDPWLSSFGCWGNAYKSSAVPAVSQTASVANAVPVAVPTTLSLQLGVSSPSVLIVQQMLNKAGFTVAASGPGSVGNETTMYGALTRAAVRRFQCAKNITCGGDESTTGYGMVDDRTYKALEAAVNATQSSAPAATGPTAEQKAAEAATIRVQISTLTSQIDALNARLNELTR